ncbi:MAG: sugar phosphate isomerase/epimerase [Chloroflexi bacterium]|nr:MAG: sugar phosphate isomerase/epimerase [Chloroflexota bacterium]
MSTNTSPAIAVQLYSLRNYTKDFAELIRTVAGVGYSAVELVGTPGLSGANVAAILQENGVQAVSAHVGIQGLRDDLAGAIAFHQAVGNSHLIVPAPPSELREAADATAWRSLGAELGGFAARCADAGMSVGYHNHWWEMAEVDGKRIIDWLLEGDTSGRVFLELDLAWAVKGGGDPLAILQQYAGRCPRVHAKDLAQPGENADQMGLADVGYGTLDWDALIPAAKAAGATAFVVEHDLPADAVASVRRSLEFLRGRV